MVCAAAVIDYAIANIIEAKMPVTHATMALGGIVTSAPGINWIGN